ncbi:hypothetical protein [Streptomyces sp. NPDC003077]|uniref:hypothetical protein n=1 Tax=Streptomyces sp. NPDC003077 TaxID=3154443 RepID=UPI0033BD45AD
MRRNKEGHDNEGHNNDGHDNEGSNNEGSNNEGHDSESGNAGWNPGKDGMAEMAEQSGSARHV